MKPKSWLLWHSMVKWKFSPSSYKKGVNSDFVARCAVWIHGHIRVGKSNTKHTYNTCFGFIMDTRIAIRLNAWPPTAVVIFYYQHQPFFVHKTFFATNSSYMPCTELCKQCTFINKIASKNYHNQILGSLVKFSPAQKYVRNYVPAAFMCLKIETWKTESFHLRLIRPRGMKMTLG